MRSVSAHVRWTGVPRSFNIIGWCVLVGDAGVLRRATVCQVKVKVQFVLEERISKDILFSERKITLALGQEVV